MPTNAELIADIKAIDENAETDGLVKAELEELLEELQTRPEAEPVPPYTVATKVRSLTTLKGIKAAGAEVTAAMFSGGEQKLAALVEAGLVVKN